MHAIEYYYPDAIAMTREELVEELRNAKNELLYIMMDMDCVPAIPQPHDPHRFDALPTMAWLREQRVRDEAAFKMQMAEPPPETTFERLQGISTESIDARIQQYGDEG